MMIKVISLGHVNNYDKTRYLEKNSKAELCIASEMYSIKYQNEFL